MLQNQKNDEIIPPCNENCSFCFLNYTDILSENYLFRNIEKKEIGRIIRDVHHQVKKCSKGDVVAGEGESYDKLMILVRGSVVGEMMDFEGRVLRVEQRKAPETVATAFIFGKNNRLPVTITALEETRILLIPREDLLRLFNKNDRVMRNFMDIMANRAQFLGRQLKMLGLNSIRGKIAHYLLEQVKIQNSTSIQRVHTQHELSEIFGVSRPSVARALREMNRDLIIESKGKRVKILDKAELSRLLR